MDAIAIEQHSITVTEHPHNCGGYEIDVTCTCGYAGTEARIEFGCADKDPCSCVLDTTHIALLARHYAGESLPGPSLPGPTDH